MNFSTKDETIPIRLPNRIEAIGRQAIKAGKVADMHDYLLMILTMGSESLLDELDRGLMKIELEGEDL